MPGLTITVSPPLGRRPGHVVAFDGSRDGPALIDDQFGQTHNSTSGRGLNFEAV